VPPTHPRPTRSKTLAAAAVAALSLGVSGCGGGSSSPSAGPSSGSTVGAAQPVTSTVALGRVAGNLHQPNKKVFKKHRQKVLTKVGHAVDTWIDGGFVGVSYPRDSFASAFQAFTAPARRDAGHQQKLMTNWGLRHRIDGVEVKKRKVTVDVLAPHGRPAGATARVELVFSTTGDATKRVTVHARLFLNPDAHGTWRIFGYDVAKGGQ
jgi:hypothetical protein